MKRNRRNNIINKKGVDLGVLGAIILTLVVVVVLYWYGPKVWELLKIGIGIAKFDTNEEKDIPCEAKNGQCVAQGNCAYEITNFKCPTKEKSVCCIKQIR